MGFRSSRFSLLAGAAVLLCSANSASAANCSLVGDLGVSILEKQSGAASRYELFVQQGNGEVRVLDIKFRRNPKSTLEPGKVRVKGRVSRRTLTIDDPNRGLARAAQHEPHSANCDISGGTLVNQSGIVQGSDVVAMGPIVPAYNSRPGAYAQLYLNFVGDNVTSWGGYTPGVVPPYDQDGNPSSFSATELDNIYKIWQRVSEKFTPFEINVTTVDPGVLTDKMVVRADIGGGSAWTGGTYGGIAYVGGFTNSSPNIVFVFPAHLANGNPKSVAEATAHEAGHNFGLRHQSEWNGTTKVAEYYQGTSAAAPTMGVSYYAARGLWWYGTTTSSTTMQDDLAVLTNLTNGFGYRADDHGDNAALASPLNILPDSSINSSGVIETLTDLDVFYFNTSTGTLTITGSPAVQGGMLDLRLELRDAADSVVAVSDTTALGETITTYAAAGAYYVVVAGHGAYGDLGQYTISGSVTPDGTICSRVTPAAALSPSSQNAAPGSTVNYDLIVTNRDTSACEPSTFSFSYADSFGGTGAFSSPTVSTIPGASAIVTVAVSVPADSTAGFKSFTLTANDAALADHLTSANGTVVVKVPDTTPPSVPTNFQATLQKKNAAKLTWSASTDNSGAVAGYRIYRNGTFLASSTSTTYNDRALSRGVSYTYQVLAYDAAQNVSALSTAVTVRP